MKRTLAALIIAVTLAGCDSGPSGQDCFEWAMRADNATTQAEADRWADRLVESGCV